MPLALNHRKPCPLGAEDCPCVNLHSTGMRNEPAPIFCPLMERFVKLPFKAFTVPLGKSKDPSVCPLMLSLPPV